MNCNGLNIRKFKIFISLIKLSVIIASSSIEPSFFYPGIEECIWGWDYIYVACEKYLREVMAEYVSSHFGFKGYACGLCQVNVPCESRIPGGMNDEA